MHWNYNLAIPGNTACPDPGREDDEDPVDDDQEGEEPEKKEPEPDENVDFFID